jgi:penicillin-binding protein 1B
MESPLFEKLRHFVTRKRLRLALLSLLLMLSGFALYLDITVRIQFEGKRWALPARVYARPLELYPGLKLRPEQLGTELAMLGYLDAGSQLDPGSFRQQRNEFTIATRPFVFWDGTQAALQLRADFDGSHLRSLTDLKTEKPVTLARLDPLLIGGIYPAHNEDRVLVKLNEMPSLLIKGLIAVEDRQFYTHHGVDPRGVARALVTTLRGAGLQGGSTLTQQLVKNFPDAERICCGAFTEMISTVAGAALFKEKYSKPANEIYLGQDGNRAIHGFVCSHFISTVRCRSSICRRRRC